MKGTFKLIGSLALATVGASIVQAQAYGFGDGYASASFFASQPGLYFTGETGAFNNYSYYSALGSNWSRADYVVGSSAYNTTNPFSVEGYGWSSSWPEVGGAGLVGASGALDVITITNLSSHDDLLTVDAYTSGYGYSQTTSWQDLAQGYGFGEVIDTTGIVQQFSAGYAQSLGRGEGGDSAYFEDYDPYNGYGGQYFFGGNVFPYGDYGWGTDAQVYTILLTPGSSDTFSLIGQDYHESYSTTPGPAALAPFGLGLVGLFRRRPRS